MNRIPTDAEVLAFYHGSGHISDKTPSGFAPHTAGRAEFCEWYLIEFMSDGAWTTKRGEVKTSRTECRDRAIYHLEKALNRERRAERRAAKQAERAAQIAIRRHSESATTAAE